MLAALVLTMMTCAYGGAAASSGSPSVVVVGVPGLRWDQVSAQTTPALWRLSHTSSVGSLSIRSADPVTCPGDGWLTVGAGNRVRVRGGCSAAMPVTVNVGGARIDGFSAIDEDNHSLDFGSAPGILASSLSGSSCVAAVGPEAALGAADRTGRVAAYATVVNFAALRRCPVTLVGTGTVVDDSSAAAADRVVAAVEAQRPAGSALLVIGLSDTDPNDRAHLHVALATGGPFSAGRLVSQSTRRAPYVQLIDVTATILSLRGHPPVGAVDGQPWRSAGGRTSPGALADLDTAAGAAGAALPWAGGLLVGLVVAGAALALTARHRLAALVLLVALAAPVATYLLDLAPWWRAPAPTLVTLVATPVLATLLAAVPFRLGESRSWVVAGGALTGFTFVVLVIDLLTGAHLQMDSVLGYSPLVAGRFAGVGNVAFAVLAAAAVLLATSLAITLPRRFAVAGVVTVGLVAVAADGAPMWGSDVGGVLALVPGFAVLVLMCRRTRVSVAKLAVIAGAAVAVVLVFGAADYARPTQDQTHLGRFVGKLLHGGAGTVLLRKARSDLTLLTANAATLLVPLVITGVLLAVLRPRPRLARAYRRHPQLRYGYVSLAVVALIGLVVNDSGVAIPAVAALLGIPYALVVLTADIASEPGSDGPDVLP